MGDRTYCNYKLGGKLDETQARELAEILVDHSIMIGPDEDTFADDVDEALTMMRADAEVGNYLNLADDEMNMGECDDLEAWCKANNISFYQYNASGDGYGPSAKRYDAEEEETTFIDHAQDIGAVMSINDVIKMMGEKQNALEVMEDLKARAAADAWTPEPLVMPAAPPPPPEPEGERLTFTAFCQQANGGGTIWINKVEGVDADHAAKNAAEQCAGDWDYKVADVHVLGLAKGELEIVMWDDLCC